MRIRDIDIANDFCKKHADATEPMEQWVKTIKAAQWKTPHELKADFPSADPVGNRRYVFNLKGNNIRIIALVVFFEGVMEIRFVGTHAEYDKLNKTKDIKTI